ncbi:NADP-dependent oxidoreductase domain-containing protein [Aspergillus egyptiacus]|nr:NADP-dependent oxidoreductase domain-containing protein [Aspergillus egyptiacus]
MTTPPLPPLILGGAGFSHQLTATPTASQTRQVLLRAFDLGVRAIDTSAYYEPSEELIGQALAHPDTTSRYRREDYMLMTKAGRVSATESNYSPEWIRYSVTRSLERLRTGYLDVVFCHDVEFAPGGEEGVVGAVGVLLEMVKEGKVRFIGISGYPIGYLARVAERVRRVYGRSVDVVQTWAQMTLQNDRLEQEGLRLFTEARVRCVCSSSPLACGLLREEGVPVGSLGDWHPAPEGLRVAASEAAVFVKGEGESLARVALRYALRRAQEVSSSGELRVATIIGGVSVAEVEENIGTAMRVFRREEGLWQWSLETGSPDQKERDEWLFAEVQRRLGEWRNYSFAEEPADDGGP